LRGEFRGPLWRSSDSGASPCPSPADDLGADWLDRLELMIVIEDQFAGVEITDEDVDQIEVVGDLIRHIETMDNERHRRP
jgi:acyl carrier protein